MRYRLFLTFALIVVGCSSETTTETATPMTESTTSRAEPEFGSDDEQVFVIDVRSQDEWDRGHVEQAVLIPHTEIADRIGEITDDKDAKIVVYCAVGGRAGKAKATLEELGFTNVENAGGFDDVRERFK